MNKADLNHYVCTRLATTRACSEEIVSAVLRGIQDGVQREGQVVLAGFGCFRARRHAERFARHPRTGVPVRIPARVSVQFRAALAWKRELE